MPNIGFRDRETALLLKQIAAERRLRPHISTRIEQEEYRFGASVGIVHFQIEGAHSLNTVLDCFICGWDPALHLDVVTTRAKCIDRRQGVPIAPDNATGLGHWKPSDDHGRIIYIIDLDCPTT